MSQADAKKFFRELLSGVVCIIFIYTYFVDYFFNFNYFIRNIYIQTVSYTEI